MKNSLVCLLTLLAVMFTAALPAQQSKIIDLGIFKNSDDHKKLEVRLRPAQDVASAPYSAGVFTVRIPSEYGATLRAEPGSSPYGYVFAGPVGKADGYDYYRFQFSGSVYMVNWEKGEEYPVLALQVEGDLPREAPVELVTGGEWTRQKNGDYYQELSGQELQREFYYLPLRVRDFHAEPLADRTVELNWELESEEMLAQSEVEYSVDGRDFDLIGKVPAHGESGFFQEPYSHLHKQPAEVNYYRIRLTDINGAVTYTPVRVINFDDINAEFAVFPNPTSGPITIASRNLINYPGGVDYQVIDNNGKVLWTDRLISDNLNTDLSQLAAGIYFIKIYAGQDLLSEFKVVLATE